jgi:hypothetical protein
MKTDPLPAPLDKLKDILGIPEYDNLDSILTEAIGVIEQYQEDKSLGPTERELRFMERLNRKDEERARDHAEWLEDRNLRERDVTSARKILDIMRTRMEGHLFNYVSLRTAYGMDIPIVNAVADMNAMIDAEFRRVTGIDPL